MGPIESRLTWNTFEAVGVTTALTLDTEFGFLTAQLTCILGAPSMTIKAVTFAAGMWNGKKLRKKIMMWCNLSGKKLLCCLR